MCSILAQMHFSTLRQSHLTVVFLHSHFDEQFFGRSQVHSEIYVTVLGQFLIVLLYVLLILLIVLGLSQ